jgi:hypothetical protein
MFESKKKPMSRLYFKFDLSLFGLKKLFWSRKYLFFSFVLVIRSLVISKVHALWKAH